MQLVQSGSLRPFLQWVSLDTLLHPGGTEELNPSSAPTEAQMRYFLKWNDLHVQNRGTCIMDVLHVWQAKSGTAHLPLWQLGSSRWTLHFWNVWPQHAFNTVDGRNPRCDVSNLVTNWINHLWCGFLHDFWSINSMKFHEAQHQPSPRLAPRRWMRTWAGVTRISETQWHGILPLNARNGAIAITHKKKAIYRGYNPILNW